MKKTQEQIRKEKNKLLVERMKNGESLSLIPASATFFQPRPIIKKDKDAINKLYKTEEKLESKDE